jgi:hypothetical protein
MRAMRTGIKTTIASMLALGVCVWVGETRADGPSGSDEISMDGGVGTSDLALLSGGTLVLATASTEIDGTSHNNTIDNSGGELKTGSGMNINSGSHGIVMQAANTGINSLIQQTATINVIFAPQN